VKKKMSENRKLWDDYVFKIVGIVENFEMKKKVE